MSAPPIIDRSASAPSALAGVSPAVWAALALAVFAALAQFPGPFDGNGDASWLLIVAGRMLDGATPYFDILETNPPMSALLYVPPVWLARQIGIAPEITMYGLVAGLALASLAASWRFSEAALPDERARRIFILLAAVALLLLPTRCFAQREHIAAIALLPYLTLLAARWGGGRASVAAIVLAGFCAGLALSIKPHFGAALALAHLAPLIAAVMARGVGVTASRSILGAVRAGRVVTPEAVIALALLGAYVALVATAFPAFRETIYPRVALVYLPHRLTPFEFIAQPATVMALGAFVLMALARPGRLSPLALVFAAAAVGGFVAYGVQAKGWAYHQLPTLVFAGIALGLTLAQARTLSLTPAFLGALVLFGALVPGLFATHAKPRALEAEIRRHGEGRTVLIATSNLGLSFPLIQRAGAHWVGRSASLWMSEGAFAIAEGGVDEAHRQRLVALFELDRALFVEDALRARPDIIGLAAPDPASDLLPWAKADPRMAALLASYRETAFVDHVRVFVRADVLARTP